MFGWGYPRFEGFLGVMFMPFVIIIALWDLFWKAKGMWKAAKHDSLGWFIALMIFNTAGILPILYLYVFSRDSKAKKKK